MALRISSILLTLALLTVGGCKHTSTAKYQPPCPPPCPAPVAVAPVQPPCPPGQIPPPPPGTIVPRP
jgi:hypothetical protein